MVEMAERPSDDQELKEAEGLVKTNQQDMVHGDNQVKPPHPSVRPSSSSNNMN